MKNVIIGTAGHVDHGKTALIKALTGLDTDRLKEEKKRGITIELGFAHLDYEDGLRAGIVDVPGHEKFIRNMLMGAGGIDLAMLVVAADEGFMPQTEEHLGILSLLGIKDGLVVITKCDIADPEWTDLIKEDVKARVKGTFLEGKEIHTVSAYTGEGIPELKKALRKLIEEADEKNPRIPFRLPIDRVFSVEGFGTVVTGTLIDGVLKKGDPVEILPSELETKVRNLQVHGEDVEFAYAGQRVAVNLAGLKKSSVQRGETLAKPGSIGLCSMLDVRLQILPSSQRTVLSGSRVHFHIGSGSREAKVVLLEKDELKPGESCYAQIRMKEPVPAKNGDRFVIRFFSPAETVGGGIVLDASPAKHGSGNSKAIEALKIKESGSDSLKYAQAAEEAGLDMINAAKLTERFHIDGAEAEKALKNLAGNGKVIEFFEGNHIAAGVLENTWKNCKSLLEKYHAQNPLHAGMKLPELRQKLFAKLPIRTGDAVISEFLKEGKIKQSGDRYALFDFSVQLTKKQIGIKNKLLKIYSDAGINVPGSDEVLSSFSPKEKDDCRKVMESLVYGGGLVMLSPQITVTGEVYEKMRGAAAEWFKTHETLTLAEYRTLLNTSRKYALAALEYFDKNKYMKKDGDFRSPTPLLYESGIKIGD